MPLEEVVVESVCVMIRQGFGSHTTSKLEIVNDKEKRVSKIHRATDTEGFFLPLTAYKEFMEKYLLCDPETKQVLTQEIMTVDVSMAQRIAKATAKALPQAADGMSKKLEAVSKKVGKQ